MPQYFFPAQNGTGNYLFPATEDSSTQYGVENKPKILGREVMSELMYDLGLRGLTPKQWEIVDSWLVKHNLGSL